VIRALVAIFAVAPVFSFPQTWGAKYLVRAFAVDQGDVGDYLWFPPLVFDLVAILFGDLASRQRRAEGVPPRMLFAVDRIGNYEADGPVVAAMGSSIRRPQPTHPRWVRPRPYERLTLVTCHVTLCS
jgi:hypothetical protein